MAKHIPIDIVRSMELHISDMKSAAATCRELEREKRIQAVTLEQESIRLETMLDQWKVLFPE